MHGKTFVVLLKNAKNVKVQPSESFLIYGNHSLVRFGPLFINHIIYVFTNGPRIMYICMPGLFMYMITIQCPPSEMPLW